MGCKWSFSFPCGWCQEPQGRDLWWILRCPNVSSVMKVTTTMRSQGNPEESYEGEVELMTRKRVSVQRLQGSSSGPPRDFCDFSPGFPHCRQQLCTQGRNGRVSPLVFSKCSWEWTFLWLLNKFSPELNSGDTVYSPSTRLCFVICQMSSCSLQTWNGTSWAALIFTCPLKES